MKVLFLTTYDFWSSTNNGSKMISKRNYEMLKKVYGDENLYYCGIEDDMNKYNDWNRSSFPVTKSLFSRYYNYLFCRYRYNKKNEKKILKYIEKVEPEVIFFDGSLLGGLYKRIPEKKTIVSIVFFHNIESNVSLKAITRNGKFKPYRFIRYKCNKYNEGYIAGHANYRICMNKRDSVLLKKYHDADVDFYLPTTIADKCSVARYKSVTAQVNTLLFVGSYFVANTHGLDWFITKVFPFIECKLLIVGSGMEKYTPPVKTGEIDILGGVDDLAEYYMDASAVICPIFIGDGMKTKTAEAMMYGKTIFATDEALEGYDVDDIGAIYRCNSAEEFINSINAHFMRADAGVYSEDVRKRFLEKYESDAKHREFNEWILKNGLIDNKEKNM